MMERRISLLLWVKISTLVLVMLIFIVGVASSLGTTVEACPTTPTTSCSETTIKTTTTPTTSCSETTIKTTTTPTTTAETRNTTTTPITSSTETIPNEIPKTGEDDGYAMLVAGIMLILLGIALFIWSRWVKTHASTR